MTKQWLLEIKSAVVDNYGRMMEKQRKLKELLLFFVLEWFSIWCGDVKHDKSARTITIDKERRFDGIYPGLGMYAQYYVYGKKFMIEQEGEYAFEDGKLYIK